jgi:hypothetical protein
MAQVSTNITGNGTVTDYHNVNVSIPDAGTTITVFGQIQRATAPPLASGQTPATNGLQTLNGTVTSPGVPGGGSNYTVYAADWTSGALAVHNSTTSLAAARALLGATEIEIFNQVLASTASSNLSLTAVAMPDTW